MDPALFERLLREEESSTLDYKREQYRFAKASDQEKAELLKDLLGFANAWRRSDAYILIGVDDVRGGRANVVGIEPADHLDDHSVQQFVASLTNQPVRFHYEAFALGGKHVGILRIDAFHPRPVYLRKHYGFLKRGEVYVRRGSSTDPTRPADPDEIAQMGRASETQVPELTLEFAETRRDRSLGDTLVWDSEFCAMPQPSLIPDLARPSRDSWDIPVAAPDMTNIAYFRERAKFEWAKRLYRPARLVLVNTGRVAAAHVRVELSLATDLGAALMEHADLPPVPSRERFLVSPIAESLTSGGNVRQPGAIDIDKNEERFRLVMECGDVQPKRRVWSEVFYAAKRTSGTVIASGQIFARNLATPVEFSLTMTARVTDTELSVQQVTALLDAEDFGD